MDLDGLFEATGLSPDDDATQIEPGKLDDDPEAPDIPFLQAVERKIGLPLGEIVAIIAAAATIVGMCLLLRKFNGKVVPSWSINPPKKSTSTTSTFISSKHITLNSILSLFSTTTEVLLAYLLTKSLTKSTWLWFMGKKDRKLADMTVFYKVAKKSWKGAVSLILMLKWKYVFAIRLSVNQLMTELSKKFCRNRSYHRPCAPTLRLFRSTTHIFAH
jgi:Protein of unknown function (DUF3176)